MKNLKKRELLADLIVKSIQEASSDDKLGIDFIALQEAAFVTVNDDNSSVIDLVIKKYPEFNQEYKVYVSKSGKESMVTLVNKRHKCHFTSGQFMIGRPFHVFVDDEQRFYFINVHMQHYYVKDDKKNMMTAQYQFDILNRHIRERANEYTIIIAGDFNFDESQTIVNRNYKRLRLGNKKLLLPPEIFNTCCGFQQYQFNANDMVLTTKGETLLNIIKETERVSDHLPIFATVNCGN